MKTIRKVGTGGFHLRQAHANPPTTADNARTRWSGFSHKGALSQALLEEQHMLCCYSELRCDSDELRCHIEHVEPKSRNPARTFDYFNLAASALDSENDLVAFKALGHVVFGGHAKRSQHDSHRFVSPHQADCARYFSYLSDGRVVPSQALSAEDEDRARYTIDLLNLNSPYLVNRRQQWWDELDKLFEEHQAKDWSLSDLIAVDLVPTAGALSQFFSVTRLFFGGAGEMVLRESAPELI